jgi:hypothetical protein
MNEKRKNTTSHTLVISIWKTPVLLAISVALAASFWIASLPMALAAASSPADLIQANLPHAMTMASAPKAEILSAVCKAVTKNQKKAPEIVRAAATARKEFTADILKTAVDCLHLNAEHPDCELARHTLQEAIAIDPDRAASLNELFIQLVPGCAGTPEEGPGNFASVNTTSSLSGGGGGAAGNGDACTVCHANQSIQVACSGLNTYLKNHPGDTAGACEATPNANR